MRYSDVRVSVTTKSCCSMIVLIVTTLKFGEATNHASHHLDTSSLSRLCHENKPPINWTSGLRESIYRALIRTNDNDYYLHNHLHNLPIIHLKIHQEQLFGDIVLLAKGQIYQTPNKNYKIVQEVCGHRSSSSCDDDHQDEDINKYDEIIGLWTVERIRHHTQYGYGFEFHYNVILRNPYEYQIVKYDGTFDYSLPGHLYIVRLCTVRENIHWSPSYQTTKTIKWNAKDDTKMYGHGTTTSRSFYMDKWDLKPNTPRDYKPPAHSVWVHRNIPARPTTPTQAQKEEHSLWIHRNAKKLNSIWIHKNVNHDRHKVPSWYKNIDNSQNTHVTVDQNGVKHIIRFPEFSPEIKDEDIFGELPSPPILDTTTHKITYTTLDDFLNYSSTAKIETKPNYEQEFDELFNYSTTRKNNIQTTTNQNITPIDFLATNDEQQIQRKTTTRSFRKMSPTLPSFILPDAGTTQKRSHPNNSIPSQNTFLDEQNNLLPEQNNLFPTKNTFLNKTNIIDHTSTFLEDENILVKQSTPESIITFVNKTNVDKTSTFLEDQNVLLKQSTPETFTTSLDNNIFNNTSTTISESSNVESMEMLKTSTERFDLLETKNFIRTSTFHNDLIHLDNSLPTKNINETISTTKPIEISSNKNTILIMSTEGESFKNVTQMNESKNIITNSILDEQQQQQQNTFESSTVENLITSTSFETATPASELLPPKNVDQLDVTTTPSSSTTQNNINMMFSTTSRLKSTELSDEIQSTEQSVPTTLSTSLTSKTIPLFNITTTTGIIPENENVTSSNNTEETSSKPSSMEVTSTMFTTTHDVNLQSEIMTPPTENINDMSTTIKFTSEQQSTTTNSYSEITFIQSTIIPPTIINNDNFGDKIITKPFQRVTTTSKSTTINSKKPDSSERTTTTTELSTKPQDILKIITTQSYPKTTFWRDRTRKTTPTIINEKTIQNQQPKTTTSWTRYRNRNRTESQTTRDQIINIDETSSPPSSSSSSSSTRYRYRNRTETPIIETTRLSITSTSDQSKYTTKRNYEENITRKQSTKKPTKTFGDRGKPTGLSSTIKYPQRKPTIIKPYSTRPTKPTSTDDFLNNRGSSSKRPTKINNDITLFPNYPQLSTTTERTQQIMPPESGDDFLTANQNVFTPKGTLPVYFDKRYRKTTTPRQKTRKYTTKARRPYRPEASNDITSPSSILQPPLATVQETTTAATNDEYFATKFPIKNTLQPTSESLATSTVPLIISNTIGTSTNNMEEASTTSNEIILTTIGKSFNMNTTTTTTTDETLIGNSQLNTKPMFFSTTESYLNSFNNKTKNCAACIFNGTFENGTSSFIATSQNVHLHHNTSIIENDDSKMKMIPRFSVSTPKNTNKYKELTTPMPTPLNCTFNHHATTVPSEVIEQTLDDFSITTTINTSSTTTTTTTTRQPFIPQQPRYKKFAVTRHRKMSTNKHDLDTLSNTHFYDTTSSVIYNRATTPRPSLFMHTERNLEFRTSQSISTSVSINVGKK